MRLILASASPRRAELLRAACIDFDAIGADVDESVMPGESPEQHVRRLAESKARAVLSRAGQTPILAADTVVVLDGGILGKPVDESDARRMLRLLSGRQHEVMTGVCLANLARPAEAGHYDRPDGPAKAGHYVAAAVAVTMVEFAPLSDAEIDWYVSSGEPADKAGAYGVQGLASRFVTRIDGSYSNVVGLPVAVVYRLCKAAGLLIS